MTLEELLHGCDFVGAPLSMEREITGVAYDSRRVDEGFLFVAIKGEKHDGHDFISEALRKGAIVIIGERNVKDTESTYIRVNDSRKALACITHNFYGMPSENLTLVGITGTNGKTTTATLLYKLFIQLGYKTGLISHAHDIFVEKPMLATKLHDSVFVSAISEFNRNYLADLLGPWIREKTEIVRCGIDPSYYQNGNRNQNGRSKSLEIMSVGSLQPYKGHMYLVQACVQLKQRGIPFHCRIVGGGDLRPFLEQTIRENELAGLVESLGPRTQDEVSRLLHTANCYVQPSVITSSGKMEGIPWL